jgi:hypothetical protein
MPRFQPEEMIRVLGRHRVDYVLIGGLAATLHGSPLRTGDADICPDSNRENLERLAAALVEMEARISAPDAAGGLAFACDAKFLEGVTLLNLITKYGDLDISFEPAGTLGYAELRAQSVQYDLEGLTVPVAALGDIIRSKEAAGRAKDRAALPTLRALLEQASASSKSGSEPEPD